MDNNTIYRVSDGVYAREEAFGLLVVSKTTPALALNADMKAVWQLIDGKSSFIEILNTVKMLYPCSDVEPRVRDIFEKLLQISLIQVVNEA